MVPAGIPVFEVGTGLGALTHSLLHTNELYAIEIDRGIHDLLLKLIPGLEGHLFHADFLKMDLEHLPFSNYFLVSNLPYSISGEAIRRFIDAECFNEGVLMLQKEFIDRMTAPVGSKHYSPLGILCQTFLVIEPTFFVRKQAFFPAPTVDSQVIRVRKTGCTLDQSAFRAFLLKSFAAKRKTLQNNMKPLGIDTDVILAQGLNPQMRPQELSPLQWQGLFGVFSSDPTRKK